LQRMTDQPVRADAPWWQSGVVYQIYPRSFQDSNADGVGDLRGIQERLPYLVDLGVDAIWISPFYPSPMRDFGYDVSDYCDVDPVFGTVEDARALIVSAHSMGLKVIVDFVPNHTSDEHPWFIDSRSSRESSKRDWYIWTDTPNNWVSMFGGSAWEFDETTGQSYLHTFLKSQPDLNWRNPEVRAAMHDALRFWMDQGVDGFRFDVAHHIGKHPELLDNPLVETDARVDYFKPMGDWGLQHHQHDLGHPDLMGWHRDIREVVDTYTSAGQTKPSTRYTVGEIHEFDWRRWASYYGETPGGGFNMPFNFSLLKAGWNAAAIRAAISGCEAAVPAWGWPNWVLGNHDETRLATRFGVDAARAALVLLLTLRGTPTLYYGDELGLPDTFIPEDRQQDPWGLQVIGLGLGRDPERTPMPWDGSVNAGFCSASVEPWLPIGEVSRGPAGLHVEAAAVDPGSTLNLVKLVLRLRGTYSALSTGPLLLHDANPQIVNPEIANPELVTFTRQDADSEWLVAIRVGGLSVQSFDLRSHTGVDAAHSQATIEVDSSDYRQSGQATRLGAVRIAPNSATVLRLIRP
jgi:alpha-glucosidase